MQSGLQIKIKNFLDSTGLSVSALERQAGLKINVARNILRGQSKKPTAETLQAIATVMGCSVSDLLGVKREVFSTIETPAPDESPVIDHPAILSEALNGILKVSTEDHYTLTLDQTLLVLGEVYTYSIKKHPPQIDMDFIKWFIEKTVR